MSEQVERIKNSFPDELQKLLEFYEEGDYIIAKPKRFLVDEEFPMVAGIVKELGGEYKSLGKLSHFRFLKPETTVVVEGKEKDVAKLLDDAISMLQKAKEKLREAGY